MIVRRSPLFAARFSESLETPNIFADSAKVKARRVVSRVLNVICNLLLSVAVDIKAGAVLWSMAMNDTHNKPYTTAREVLPVLVPCQAGEAHDGVANFILVTERTETGTQSRSGPKVRLLRNQDITDEAIRKALTPADYELLTATLALKKSFDTHDPLLAEKTYPKLFPLLPPRPSDPKLAIPWAGVDVAKLATSPMQTARLVLWFVAGKFIPTIYCPDLKTAIFVRAFLSLQTCAHCGKIFGSESENVRYCTPAHGHAHRVARMRAKQRRKERHGKK
jgi:hypothetical protein